MEVLANFHANLHSFCRATGEHATCTKNGMNGFSAQKWAALEGSYSCARVNKVQDCGIASEGRLRDAEGGEMQRWMTPR